MTERALRSVPALVDAGILPAERARAAEAVARRYAVAVTPAIAARIDNTNPDDPIARQFVPDARELRVQPEELADPIGDEAHSPLKGVVHRYPDRVLLKPVMACPVYCRFCFRREMVGPGNGALTPAELEAALDYIRGRQEIWEVILTGGDPLILSARRMDELLQALAAIEHVGIVRLHSRVPVVDPERVTRAMLRALKCAKPVWLAVHCNHKSELGPAALAALGRLADAGVPLISQTVLLKGVNDDADTLAALFRALVAARVKPYYLHQADLAPGTAHFRTSIADGQRIMRELRGRLSGIAQPTYVLDIPGGHGKVPVGPHYLEDALVSDPAGRRHPYRSR